MSMPDTQEKPEQGEFTLKGRTMALYRPSEGQLLVMLTLLDLQDEEDQQQQIEMVLNFGTVVRTLFVDPDDRRWVHRGLANNSFVLEDYFDLAKQIIDEYAPDRANNRAERRAPAKRAAPAKRVRSRP